MHIEELRDFCLSLPGVEESVPFGPDTLVFKVMGKAFALTGLDSSDCRVNLKCDPERAVDLRSQYPETILPGYHMNKRHWNTVICDQNLSGVFIKSLIQHSYDLVVSGLSRKNKMMLDALG